MINMEGGYMEHILKREVVVSPFAIRVCGVAVFIVLTALGAFVRIPLPFTPVPITLQTFFVLLSGLMLGGNLGAVAQLGYVALGILGVPLYSGAGSGLLYCYGPTAGYLFGFVVAAFLVGRFTRYHHSAVRIVGVLLLADACILACGTLWLKFLLGYSLQQAFFLGFVPFVAGDCLKVFVAAGVHTKIRRRLQEIFSA